VSEISKCGFTNMNVTFPLLGHRIRPGILLCGEVITLLGTTVAKHTACFEKSIVDPIIN
jgi:hypothetical protein